MNEELEKLRIRKEHKAPREAPRISGWVIVALILLAAAVGFVLWHGTASAVTVQTFRVRPAEAGATSNSSDAVVLSATGYIIAAHKIELACKVVGRVAWVGVEMGDKITKGQVLVRLEDDEYKVRVMQQQGLLDNAKAKLAELQAGSRAEEIGEARADLEQALAQLHNAETTLQRL
jgi:HlyD family secretion protein